jgi:predicted hotdog family 3-hydroxylacyl-ACP dehydratase
MDLSIPLVPHEPPLLLLDSVLEADAERCIARVRVDSGAWYADAQGAMPGWFGIELMAQTIAAFSGNLRRNLGEPPRMGYLLGTRKYETSAPAFAAGALLEVEVKTHYADGSGVSAFDCAIRQEGALLASAVLKVFEPQP